MKKAIATLVVLAVLAAVAVALNPSPERHRNRIAQAVGDRSPLARALGLGALAAFVSNYHSLGVASYTTVNGKTASWGAFGMVFVLRLDEKR
jgi:hypothetical protein